MRYNEWSDCPICGEGAVLVEIDPPDPSLGISGWSVTAILASRGCDHAEVIDARLLDGDTKVIDQLYHDLAL